MKEEQFHRGEVPQGYILNEHRVQGGTYSTPNHATHPSIQYAASSISPTPYERRETEYDDHPPRLQDPGDVAQFQTSDFEGSKPVTLDKRQSSYGAQGGIGPPSQGHNEHPIALPWEGVGGLPAPADSYGGEPNHFSTYEDSKKYRDEVDGFVEKAPMGDPSFPQTEAKDGEYVRIITNCMLEVIFHEDRKQKNGNPSSHVVPFISDDLKIRISRETAEAAAWEAFKTAKDLHMKGAIKYPKDKVEKFERAYSFAQRILEICNLYRRFKSQCVHLINGKPILKMVQAPKEQLESCRNNIKNNGNKANMLDLAKELSNHDGTNEEKAARIEEYKAKANNKADVGGRLSDKKRKRAANDENHSKEEQPARRTKRTKKTPIVSNKDISSVSTSASRRRTSPRRTQQLHHPGFAPSPLASQQYGNDHRMNGHHLHQTSTYPSTPQPRYADQYTYAQEPQYAQNPHQHYQDTQYLAARYAVQPVDHGHGQQAHHPTTPSNTSSRTAFDTPIAPESHNSHSHSHNPAPQFYTQNYGGYPLTDPQMHGLPASQQNIDQGDPNFNFEQFVHESGGAPYDNWDPMRDPNQGN